jgi:hypothetical protein
MTNLIDQNTSNRLYYPKLDESHPNFSIFLDQPSQIEEIIEIRL